MPSPRLLTAADLSNGGAPTDGSLLCIAFCARWCGACREFRAVLETIAHQETQIRFAWIDIEDDIAEIPEIDTIDFENFPVIGIFRKEIPLYFGVSMPGENIIRRLLASAATSAVPLCAIPEETRTFARRIHLAALGED
jgi:thiol-disulfide isomerase/thioredoxin